MDLLIDATVSRAVGGIELSGQRSWPKATGQASCMNALQFLLVLLVAWRLAQELCSAKAIIGRVCIPGPLPLSCLT